MTDQIPACFSVSYFNPGEGECAVGCRLAERCKPAYLAQARELLAANPSGLTDEEHAFVLEHAFAAAPAKPARKRRSPRLKVVPADVAPAPAPAAAPTSPADGGSLSDGERARIEALVKQVEATVAGQGAERSATRKSSEPWTDARRHPLSSFKPASVPALVVQKARRALRSAEEQTIGEALTDYKAHLGEKGNKPKSIWQTVWRIGQLFTSPDDFLRDLRPQKCADLYDALATRTTRFGKPMSADTHRNILAEAKSFLRWCHEKTWISRNPLEHVKGKGKRHKGKAQLRIDEVRKWDAVAVAHADRGVAGAVAAMVTLYMDLRCTEIVTRAVRDLDDGGRLLWIPDSKTEAGRRTLEVPEFLRPYLKRLAKDKLPEALLFGYHDRAWPRKWVQRICKQAGVPRVTAHGMRGLHASLAVEQGATGRDVALAMGHSSDTTTFGHYAKRDSVAKAKQTKVLTVVRGGVTDAKGKNGREKFRKSSADDFSGDPSNTKGPAN